MTQESFGNWNPPVTPQDQSDDDFDIIEQDFFMNFSQSEPNKYSIDQNIPQDPQLLSFSSYKLAISYLSSQPFPISDLANYAIVFPLQYWHHFPHCRTLEKVPCNIIKIS